MADMGSSTGPSGAVRNFVEMIDHPLIFAIAIVFLVVPTMAMLTALFKWLGMPGPASLVQTP